MAGIRSNTGGDDGGGGKALAPKQAAAVDPYVPNVYHFHLDPLADIQISNGDQLANVVQYHSYMASDPDRVSNAEARCLRGLAHGHYFGTSAGGGKLSYAGQVFDWQALGNLS